MTPDLIDAAMEALHGGLVIGLPTDTVYGIGVDPMQERALRRLYAVKGRAEEKPIPILAASIADARGFGMIDDAVAKYWPGPLTVVVRRMPAAPLWIGDDARGTVAIRVPDHPVALELLARSGPLAVTSANQSGAEPASDDIAARTALGDAVAVYLAGQGSGGAASTVVDLTSREPVVIRPGPVAWGS
ncbi:MAG TPA: L-threonylcarbamoyladenylate synthase [Acidimicrobiia bacterium]|nr:L-threonylcarbamoyladenylate synthase [Acidimicrobiia bacterium]